jgi:DNA-binding HxlR family transcriptional regulator
MKKEELMICILSVLGKPPNAVIYDMIKRELPGVSDDELEEALNELHEEEKIQVVNGWIAAIPESVRRRNEAMKNLSSDDVAWLTGTGRFSQ